jgi:hypothetical protein
MSTKDKYGYTKANTITKDLNKTVKKFKSRAYVTDKVLYNSTKVKMYLTGVSTKTCPEDGRPLRMNDDVYMKSGHLFTDSISKSDYTLKEPSKPSVNVSPILYKTTVESTSDKMLATTQFVYDSINNQTSDWISSRSDLKLSTVDSVWHYIEVRKTTDTVTATNSTQFPTSQATYEFVNKQFLSSNIKSPNTGCATAQAVYNYVNKQFLGTDVKSSNTGCATAQAVYKYVDKQTTISSSKDTGCATEGAVYNYVNKQTSISSSSDSGCATEGAVYNYVNKQNYSSNIKSSNTGCATAQAVYNYVNKQTSISSSSDSGCATEGAVYNYVNKQTSLSSYSTGCITSKAVYDYLQNNVLGNSALENNLAKVFGGSRIGLLEKSFERTIYHGSSYGDYAVIYTNCYPKVILCYQVGNYYNNYVFSVTKWNNEIHISIHKSDHGLIDDDGGYCTGSFEFKIWFVY